MNRNEAIAYLTRCADDNGNHWYQGRVWSDPATCPTCKGTDDAGWLATPCSRYGRTSADVAPIAYRHAVLTSYEGVDRFALDHSMSMAVNDHAEIETDLWEYAAELAGVDVDEIVEGYIEAQLWAQIDYDHPDDADNYPTLDENYDRDDVSDEYVIQLRQEVAALVYEHPLAVRMYMAQRRYDASQGSVASYFGHDLYLTREGHGAGFWDRGLRDLGDYLTQIAKWAGPADDLSDDGEGQLH